MKRLTILLASILILSSSIAAQQPAKPYVLIEYVEGKNLLVTTPDGITFDLASNPSLADGSEKLYAGTTIETKANTRVELKLYPNKSIIKLSQKTSFVVKGLAGDQGATTNSLALVTGKMRMVAAKSTDSKYEIRSASTVCGVRGTDFLFASETGVEESLFVKEGLIEFAKLSGDALGEAVAVPGGSAVDFYKEFKPFAFTSEQFAAASAGMDFLKLDPLQVPKQDETKAAPAAAPAPAASVGQLPAEPETKSPQSEDKPAGEENPFLKWLRNVLGMEVGAITINDTTYSKAVLQPYFVLGKLRLGLYLPVIYTNDLFNPQDWYHPMGNDEWSFGTDQDWENAPLAGVKDVASDLALKIKSLEWGDPLKDDFALKLGNLNNFTIGHGLVMGNYANDSEFPALRRIGFLMKVDAKSFGFEAMANDLSDPEIIGGRIFVRPMEKVPFALGVQAVSDLYPASDLETPGDSGDPVLIGVGADMEFAVIKGDALSIIPFIDGAGMFPYLRTPGSKDLATGFRWDILYDAKSGTAKNYGISAGFLGNIMFMDYRLEYRYFTGNFKPAFFGKGYDRVRSVEAVNQYDYLADPDAVSQSPNVMGVYGETGFRILEDKLAFTLGYMWPWSFDAGLDLEKQLEVGANDFLRAQVAVKKGLIPVLDVAGSIVYERSNLMNTLAGKYGPTVTWLDENTVFKGELAVPVPGSPNLDLALAVATAPERDKDGNIVWVDKEAGRPGIVPVISIETRFHF